MSLGRCFAGHSLQHKLDMAKKHGYAGLEVFYEDLVDVACKFETQSGKDAAAIASPSVDSLLAASAWIWNQCSKLGLHIISLQPFMHYEGLLDREEHKRRVGEWVTWLKIAHALHTDIILIPSNFLPADELSDDINVRASDLTELADLAAEVQPPVRICYESLCWGTYARTWEDSWATVQLADRPNLGLCLDTFNIAGAIYADPERPGGRAIDSDRAVTQSMERLVSTVPRDKVFLVQLADAEKLQNPLVQGHAFYQPQQPARMSWSRNCRLFYAEQEAYLPVLEISRAIFNGLGYRGYVSFELFNRRMSDSDPDVPKELARRGAVAWNRLLGDLCL